MANYIGNQPAFGEFKKLDSIASSFNGSTTQFNLQFNSTGVSVGDSTQLIVSLNGVIQEPQTAYTLGIGGSTIIFASAPASGDTCHIVLLGGVGATGTVADGSITATKLASNLRDLLEETFTGDGSATTFTMARSVSYTNQLLVTIDGVVQPTSAYSVSGTTLTISPALPASTAIRVLHIGIPGAFNAANSILASMLSASGGSAGQVLTVNSGATGVEFATAGGGGGLSDVVSDTTPQLGGNLDTNSKNIAFGDSSGATVNRLTFGAGNDLVIYHDNSTNKSHITESGTSHLIVQGQEIQFKNASGTNLMALNSAQCELFFSGSKKMETNTSGITVTGTINVNGAYTFPTTMGSAGQVLKVPSSGTLLEFAADSGGGGGIASVVADTTPQLGGNLDVNTKNIAFGDSATAGTDDTLTFGSGAEVQMYKTNNAQMYIDYNASHGAFLIRSKRGFYLQDHAAGTKTWVGMNTAGSVDLHYNGPKKFETTNTGIKVTGTIDVNGAYTLPTADGTNGQVLQTNGSGVLSFATAGGGGGISNVVEDTTPQLGGNLDANGNNILLDNDTKISFGSDTLQVKTDGSSNSIIQGSSTTYIRGSSIVIGSNGGSGGFPNTIFVTGNTSTSHVEMLYGTSKKFETTSTGVTVTGTVAATALTGDGSGLTSLPAPAFSAITSKPTTISGYGITDAATEFGLPEDQIFNITASGSSAYAFSSGATGNNPTLTLIRGRTYKFSVNASGHPFRINTSNTTGSSAAYSNGTAVINNGAEVGDIYFTVPDTAPDTLYYNCQYHSSMAGTINVSNVLRIDKANGNIGINVSNPSSSLAVDGLITSINSGTGNNSELQLQGYGNTGYINMNGTGNLIFRMGSSFTERFRIENGGDVRLPTAGRIINEGGIFLGGTSTGNHLDGYEEGTWTPTFTGAGSNPTVSYTVQTGYYTKIGSIVYATCDMRWNGWTGGSGHLKINTLPFATNGAGSGQYQNGVSINYFFGASPSVRGGYFESDTTYYYARLSSDNYSLLQANQVGTSGHFMGTVVYRTNA